MNYDPNELFQSAAALAAMGMKVVKNYGVKDDGSCTCGKGKTCPSIGKHPAGGDGWQHRATDNEDEIAGWFETTTDSVRWNIGVRLGRASGIVDVEADDESSIEVMKRFGLDKIDTVAFQGSRGPHYLFQFEDDLPNAGVVKVDGLEVRLGGGEAASQSIFPASWHRTLVQYKWLPGRSPDEVTVAKLPEEFKQAVINNSKAKGSGIIAQSREALATASKIREGGRHAWLVGMASKHASRIRLFTDSEEKELVNVLRALNLAYCEPPKDDGEVRRVAEDQFAFYRGRYLERIGRRPLAGLGLDYDAEAREFNPGGWTVCVVHSDPPVYRLRIPERPEGRWKGQAITVDLSAQDWLSARRAAERILLVSKTIAVTDPSPSRWAAVWLGETVEEDGNRRSIQGLSSKLLDNPVHDHSSPEAKQYCYAAGLLRDYLARYQKSDGDESESECLPNACGTPKWIKGEIWFKWRYVWTAVCRKSDPVSAETKAALHQRILDEAGLKKFRSGHTRAIPGRWQIFGDVEMEILGKLADEG